MPAVMMAKGNVPFFLLLSLMVGVTILLPSPTRASDADDLQDFCVADLNAGTSVNGFTCKPSSEVTSDDFFFDGLKLEGNTDNPFGLNISFGNVLTFPALNTLGISMNRLDFAPGGINPLHSHPRASEVVVVIHGKILMGIISSDNVYYSKVMEAGEMVVIPRGLVHFQRNVSPEKALAITAFNSQLPGNVALPTTIFASNPPLPNEVLTKNFQVGEKVINLLKSKLKNF